MSFDGQQTTDAIQKGYHPEGRLFVRCLLTFVILITTFETNLEDTCTRCEKYPSKLDISRSFSTIFVKKQYPNEKDSLCIWLRW